MIKTERIIYTIRFQMHVMVFLSLEQNIHLKDWKMSIMSESRHMCYFV